MAVAMAITISLLLFQWCLLQTFLFCSIYLKMCKAFIIIISGSGILKAVALILITIPISKMSLLAV